MIDLTRTLFRLSSHDENELESLTSTDSMMCDVFDSINAVKSITSDAYINYISPKGSCLDPTESQTFIPVKFHKLEDLDVESIRKKQTEFLKSLHHLHMT
ncbi:hypothetical protein EFU51_08155 [Vibrio cholerae]|nr:hypothetical protein [Vibrio cholerae]